jgi:hypothetical protein
MDRTPGRIGFMSKQRRENRWRPASCMERARAFGLSSPAPLARILHAHANGGTAPPVFPAWLATNSLQADYLASQLVRLVRQNTRQYSRSSPSPGTVSRLAAATALYWSSFPPISSSSDRVRLHPSLPQVPAASGCRTERYDGKRDLYLQHAA